MRLFQPGIREETECLPLQGARPEHGRVDSASVHHLVLTVEAGSCENLPRLAPHLQVLLLAGLLTNERYSS